MAFLAGWFWLARQRKVPMSKALHLPDMENLFMSHVHPFLPLDVPGRSEQAKEEGSRARPADNPTGPRPRAPK